jgi:hypothetical protein
VGIRRNGAIQVNTATRISVWVEHVESMGEMINVYKAFVEKPEVKRSIGRPRYRWENNIKMILGKVRWGTTFIWLKMGINGRLV